MFFLKYGKVDTLTVLAPISIILCILQIFAWGADVFIIFLLFISIIDFITNFRALLRFASGLFVDHYSVAFKIGAVITLILALIEAVVIVLFFPKNVLPSQFDVKETKIQVRGNFARGFEPAGFFERADGTIYIFEPQKKAIDKKQSVIIIPDKRGDTLAYLPYICSLAKIGYTVYSGDFFAQDLKWFNNAADSKYFRKMMMRGNSLFQTIRFEAEKEFYNFNSTREIEALLKFVKVRETKDDQFEPVFLVGDFMSDIAVEDFAKLHTDDVCGYFKLNDFAEYKTAGYGFVEQMDPIIAYGLGQKRNFDIYVPAYLALETTESIPERKYKDPEPVEEDVPAAQNQVQVLVQEGELE